MIFQIIVKESEWDGEDWVGDFPILAVMGEFKNWEDVKEFIERWTTREEMVDDEYLWGWVEFGEKRYDFYVYEVEDVHTPLVEDRKRIERDMKRIMGYGYS